MMDNGVAIAVGAMMTMRRTPLGRPCMVMRVVVLRVFGIVGETVRHRYSRTDRKRSDGSITGTDLNLSWLIFGKRNGTL